jgi:hypothetical protein
MSQTAIPGGISGGGNEYHENFYYPQAGTHFMAGLAITL